MVGEPVEERRGHLGVAEDARPFCEVEICGQQNRSALVEAANQVEEQLTAGLGEGQIPELVEDQEVQAVEQIGGATLTVAAAGSGNDVTVTIRSADLSGSWTRSGLVRIDVCAT